MPVHNRNIDEFWASLDDLSFSNEAEVEQRLILPLLRALGYEDEDIKPKSAVDFMVYEGRRGRKPEADFFVFSGLPHTRATSLMTIEAKNPREKLIDAKSQAESYAQNMRTPFILFCNGKEIELWQMQISMECNLLLQIQEGELSKNRADLELLLSKDTAIEHSKSLEFKNFDITARDFSNYEINEFERLSVSGKFIVRSVSEVSNSTKISTISDLVGSDVSSIIIAKSGYGKSVISKQICREALQRRFESKCAPLPVHVYLPDIYTSDKTIEHYVADRLSAHLTAMSKVSFYKC